MTEFLKANILLSKKNYDIPGVKDQFEKYDWGKIEEPKEYYFISFENNNATEGRFDELESWLVKNNIPFSREIKETGVNIEQLCRYYSPAQDDKIEVDICIPLIKKISSTPESFTETKEELRKMVDELDKDDINSLYRFLKDCGFIAAE